MIRLVDFSRQNKLLKKELIRNISKVIDSQAFILGQEVDEFERKFASYCKTSYAVGVGSGTDALLLSLRALGIGKGDEVITTANTFVSSILPILQVGAKPVLVDADENTLSINSALVERQITPRTRAIMPVHLYGLPVDMDPLLALAKKYKLHIIEDACQAHGSLYKERPAGGLGTVGCFSFYPSKNLGAFGEAGAIVTQKKRIAETVKILRNYGQKEKSIHELLGYNSKLDTIQAVILLTKLPHLPTWIKRRRSIASFYNFHLKDLPLILPKEPKYARANYYLYVIRTKYRDQLKDYLQKKGVLCGIHFPLPVHLQPCLRSLGYKKGDFPVSELSSRQVLSLPMYPELTRKELITITKLIPKFFSSRSTFFSFNKRSRTS